MTIICEATGPESAVKMDNDLMCQARIAWLEKNAVPRGNGGLDPFSKERRDEYSKCLECEHKPRGAKKIKMPEKRGPIRAKCLECGKVVNRYLVKGRCVACYSRMRYRELNRKKAVEICQTN